VQLAEKAWVLGGIIRGKYYEILAKLQGMQLVSHPFRKGLEQHLDPQPPLRLNRAEELFVKLIIASALSQRSVKSRVTTLAQHIARARKAIQVGVISLQETNTESEAIGVAIHAARIIGVISSAKFYDNFFKYLGNVKHLIFLNYSLSHWHSRQRPTQEASDPHGTADLIQVVSSSPDISEPNITTNWRFRLLSKSAPGRIDRKIISVDE
jgi:hypothetical protein